MQYIIGAFDRRVWLETSPRREQRVEMYLHWGKWN